MPQHTHQRKDTYPVWAASPLSCGAATARDARRRPVARAPADRAAFDDGGAELTGPPSSFAPLLVAPLFVVALSVPGLTASPGMVASTGLAGERPVSVVTEPASTTAASTVWPLGPASAAVPAVGGPGTAGLDAPELRAGGAA